ncbi:adenylate kinase [Streptomyces mexicanus]|jgi:adenylate kinase|uniref:Adenylate kinase n=1 Tax=Streptomyces mexicanus TaxID=178566 RepID=A0A7X1HXD0_9ACTN|nr:adenylate kinase [Streptomyces mexicanus]MBC2864930.1 adenylate kinase [Streptomyces mexicanus]
MTVAVIAGAPGSGKGTQASALAKRLGGLHVSTGDLFREHLARNTQLGRLARTYLDAGRYVPDDVTNGMLRDAVTQQDVAVPLVLDGYPRTEKQVAFLDMLLAESGRQAPAVVTLVVETEELVRRLARRALLENRSDDTENVIRKRQAVYLAQTAPILRIYRQRGKLREVDGTGTVEEVADRIDGALTALCAG